MPLPNRVTPVAADPIEPTLASASAAIASGSLRPEDVLEGCLTRAQQTTRLGAWVSLDAGAARRAVQALGDHRGPLHGIPVAVKDNFDMAGLPTRCGSAASDPARAARDAGIVARLRSAGGVVLGKVATHEITLGVTTRAVANPWDPTRLAGGSSGGSAVAVAVGACLLAVGSDTAGSVRIPASLCGVVGVMGPRLPADGMQHLSPALDTVGLLARSAEDLQVAWDALEHTPPGRPLKRLGVVDPAALGPIDGEVAAAVQAAISRLAEAGVETVSVSVPSFEDFARARAVVIGAEALAQQRAAGAWPARRERFGDAVRAELTRAESIDADTLTRARAKQRELGLQLRAALDGVDVLAWPTTPQVAPPADGAEAPSRADRRLAGVLTRLCGPVNAAGLAAVSVPCGLAGGLPVGLQLVARDEADALAAARMYEAVAGGAPARPAALVTGDPA